MTRVSGYYTKVARCCGAIYGMPRYRSINLLASGLWTDGYREHSLMPNDSGLRRCTCGDFFLQGELINVSEAEETDHSPPHLVPTADLPQAIAQARTIAIETAARLDYWQHLNHTYRKRYRIHREAEDAATKATWEASNPDQRTTWQKLLKKDREPLYQPALDRPVSFPPFEPSTEQRENMLALLDLTESVGGRNTLQRVELNRELGQFDAAHQRLATTSADDSPAFQKVSALLIERRQAAPVRYAA
jgi:hypothetical protein